MTVGDIHKAVVAAYREALAGTKYENYKIVPIDRETEDVKRCEFETEYDASYGREMGLRVTTVSEDLYYYAASSKKWKVECNEVQELIELRLLKGIDELSIDDIDCESGRNGETGGVLHISFSINLYEVADFDSRNADAEYMEAIDTELSIETN